MQLSRFELLGESNDIEEALEQSGLLKAKSPEETKQYVDALYNAITSPDSATYAENISRGEAQDGAEALEDGEESLEDENPSPTFVAAYAAHLRYARCEEPAEGS